MSQQRGLKSDDLGAPKGSEVDWEEPKLQVREKTAIGVLTRLNSSGELLQDFQAENYMLESAVQTTTPAALQTTDPSVVTGHGLVQRLLKFSGSMNHSLN